MNNVPNLDAMERPELMEFWARHQRGAHRQELFDDSGRGTIKAARALANYAANKAAAILCRQSGDVPTALMYERICDDIYRELPAFARW